MERSAQRAKDLVTVQEFYRRIPKGLKADLLEGVIYMASPDTPSSNDLTGFLEFLVRGYNDAKKLGGRVFVNRVAFRLSKYGAPEPDLAYVSASRVHRIRKSDVLGGPDMATEVVSRDSRSRITARRSVPTRKPV